MGKFNVRTSLINEPCRHRRRPARGCGWHFLGSGFYSPPPHACSLPGTALECCPGKLGHTSSNWAAKSPESQPPTSEQAALPGARGPTRALCLRGRPERTLKCRSSQQDCRWTAEHTHRQQFGHSETFGHSATLPWALNYTCYPGARVGRNRIIEGVPLKLGRRRHRTSTAFGHGPSLPP